MRRDATRPDEVRPSRSGQICDEEDKVEKTKILLAEDDVSISKLLSLLLKREGYEVVCAYKGQEALERWQTEGPFHCVLLDIMMPTLDGLTVLKRLREQSNVPIILMTAKTQHKDVLIGLQAGADDYVTKPFVPQELLARVAAQLRRYFFLGEHRAKEPVYQTGDLRLEVESRRCFKGDEEISLTPTEWRILLALFQEKGRILSAQALYERAWQEPAIGIEATLSVHIRHLRQKIEPVPERPIYIQVVWGRGYQLNDFQQDAQTAVQGGEK